MARTIAAVIADIKAAVAASPVIGTAGTDPLTSDSNVSLWGEMVNIVGTTEQDLEEHFDAHVDEVNGIIATLTRHTLNWYVTKAKAFQYGDSLVPETDYYAAPNPAAQVVSFAAAVELLPIVRIKAATLSGTTLGPLTSDQLTAFTAYMNDIKDAGVPLQCTSAAADTLRTAWVIYYDAQVLSATGARLDGTSNTPVQDAITAYIDNLPFNGRFVLNDMIAAVQAVQGVEIGDNTYCAAAYAALPFSAIAAYYVPDAGYMALDAAWFVANTTYVAL